MAASAAPNEMAGSTRCASVPRPETGSQPSSTAKTMASTGPSQKFGIEIPVNARVVATWSTIVPRPTAAMIPSGIDTPIATSIAAAASSSVAGSRSTMARVTGSLVRNEVPRSPRAALQRKPPYCSMSGRSRPSRVRSAATSSSAAVSPSMAWAGSPGMRWISAKTSVATPSSTGMVNARRRARNRSTGSVVEREHVQRVAALRVPDVWRNRPRHHARAAAAKAGRHRDVLRAVNAE